MREAGRLAGEVLKLAGEMVAPGVVTDDIDAYVHELCLERDAYPSRGRRSRRRSAASDHPRRSA